MSAKKQDNQVDAVRNAITGYTVVVLGIICFVLALAVLMVGVRMISAATAGTTTAATVAIASGSGTT